MHLSLPGGSNKHEGGKKLSVQDRDASQAWDVIPRTERAAGSGTLISQVEQARAATAAPAGRRLRRMFFFWLRVYVNETKRGKEQRVNVAIPIPIPFIGALFGTRLSWDQALTLVRLADSEQEDARAAGRYLESCMALEFVRVEEEDPDREKKQLVVVGFD
jgi:hypothetical protein